MGIRQIPELEPFLDGADVIDVKTVEGAVDLQTFAARMLSHQPVWVTALYVVRAGFVRLLGMKQGGIPLPPHYTAENLPVTPGERAYFFTVRLAEPDRLWMVDIKDQHLDAALGVVAEPLDASRQRFYVVTIVHYNNWAGPVYFNVIRPFHHIVVRGMAKAGLKPDHRGS